MIYKHLLYTTRSRLWLQRKNTGWDQKIPLVLKIRVTAPLGLANICILQLLFFSVPRDIFSLILTIFGIQTQAGLDHYLGWIWSTGHQLMITRSGRDEDVEILIWFTVSEMKINHTKKILLHCGLGLVQVLVFGDVWFGLLRNVLSNNKLTN